MSSINNSSTNKDKQEEIKDHTIKELKKQLASSQKDYKDLASAIPTATIAEGLEAKTCILVSDKYRWRELLEDPEVLDEFIDELLCLTKNAKFLKKLLDESH